MRPARRIVLTRQQFHDGRLSLSVGANQRDALADPDGEVQPIEHQPVVPGIGERHVLEDDAATHRAGGRNSVGLGPDRRLHLEEVDEVRQEERLVGDVGERGEERLNAAVGPGERSGQELQVAPAHRRR